MRTLDPACPEAQRLQRLRATQRALLLDGVQPDSALGAKVEESYARAAGAHHGSCPACRAYLPRCSGCGAALEGGRHGWMCPKQASRWGDLLPWNWRPRRGTVPPAAGGGRGAKEGLRVGRSARPVAVTAPPTAAPSAPRPPLRPPPAAPRPMVVKNTPGPRERAREVLGVGAGAPEEELRRAYREKAMMYHPDKVASLAPEFRVVAERKMREINEAYEVLRS